jgi:hypothetical protein
MEKLYGNVKLATEKVHFTAVETNNKKINWAGKL